MAIQQRSENGGDGSTLGKGLEALAREYGNRFLLEPAPDNRLPEHGMLPTDAMRLIGEELILDGIPQRNLATFVTTWMEPEAQRIIAENLHRNFIDHAEYPQAAEIEQRCIRMLADLFHAPGETTGARTQGSSEAIMLGALSLKWKWRERREQAGKDTIAPNLVFGGDVHVVWEKFCRYFDVEPRIIPLQRDKYTIGPEDVEPFVDENTIGVAAVLGTTFTGRPDHRARRVARHGEENPSRDCRGGTPLSGSRCVADVADQLPPQLSLGTQQCVSLWHGHCPSSLVFCYSMSRSHSSTR